LLKDTAGFYRRRITEHLIRSELIAQTFRIKVIEPVRRADESERFAVLYATDSDDFFGPYGSLLHFMQTLAEIPRFILVAIGYDDAGASDLLRMRDLLTHANRSHFHPMIKQLLDSPIAGRASDFRTITQTTDARDFLQFIRDELMPFVAAHYPVLPNDNSYSGYSAGGTFGLFTLFTEPDTFRRYLLGSPATSFQGQHFAIDLAKEYINSGLRMDCRVFLSVGELEEFKIGAGQFELVTGYYQLVKFLRTANIPGLDLTARLFPGETHATAWMPALGHGLRTLFAPMEGVRHWLDCSN
jgi:predicted alpha/beta superfamily hydrolase